MKRVIRLGDPTSHGGTVVSASSSVIINGKPVARVGDSVTCPIPGHGVVTIVERDSAWLDDGRPIALEGHKTSCGASLISTLPTLHRAPLGSGSGGASVALVSVVDTIVAGEVPISASVGDARKPVSRRDAANSPLPSTLAKTPGNCPRQLDMSAMNKDFDQQWANSFPGGVSQEQGGTIISDGTGKQKLINIAGGTSGSFSPNLSVGKNEKVEGIFHTHPYDQTEGGYTGVSLSGGDAGYLINGKQNLIVAQSGMEQFMYMRTDMTPDIVDLASLNNAQNDRIAELLGQGSSFSDASKIAAKETAKSLGLGYYEGRGGVFNRVYP